MSNDSNERGGRRTMEVTEIVCEHVTGDGFSIYRPRRCDAVRVGHWRNGSYTGVQYQARSLSGRWLPFRPADNLQLGLPDVPSIDETAERG